MPRLTMKKVVLSLITCLLIGLPLLAQDFPVEFVKIQDGFWIHRSYALFNGNKTPSNGLLVETKTGLLLVDTAWPQCIITHSHADRAGGLDHILAAKIPVLMHERTRNLLHIASGDTRIKAMDARDLGNTADAKLKSWPEVMRRLIKTYSDAKLVIPGHDQAGSKQLLNHTLALCTG